MKEYWTDITVDFDGLQLSLGNSRFTRRFDLSQGVLKTLELTDAHGRRFADATANCTDFECYGSLAPLSDLDSHLDFVHFDIVEDDVFEAPHARVSIQFTDDCTGTRTVREFFLYPELSAYGIRNRIETEVMPRFDFTSRPGIRQDFRAFKQLEASHGIAASGTPRFQEPLMDILHPAEGFHVTRTVEFFAHTDLHDHPVVEHVAPGAAHLVGNLLYCENDDGAGMMILQEAPVSSERMERDNWDFRIAENGDIHSLCWGILPEELPGNGELISYRNMVGLFHNQQEREALIKQYMRRRTERSRPQRAIVVNAWGSGNFVSHLNPQFLREEIAATAECGGDVYQIDDGWEKGGPLPELHVKNINRAIEEFWQINDKKVGSFEELQRLAEQNAVKLALWTAPNAGLMYKDYEKFSQLYMTFHQKYGFNCFKVDAAMLMSYQARRNFEMLLKMTREASGLDIFFNLDVTANLRGGFFMFNEYGSIFLENRYTNLVWGVGYHPERTLRNFWNLSRYVRAQQLQIEVPAHDDVKMTAYECRHEQDPRLYPQEYWAAIALFANPLFWFSPSSVSPHNRQALKAIAEIHRNYQTLIFGGEIHPIGEEPNGKALTGFISQNDDGTPRAAILLRELAATQATLELPGSNWKCIAGNGSADGSRLTIPTTASWAFFAN